MLSWVRGSSKAVCQSVCLCLYYGFFKNAKDMAGRYHLLYSASRNLVPRFLHFSGFSKCAEHSVADVVVIIGGRADCKEKGAEAGA